MQVDPRITKAVKCEFKPENLIIIAYKVYAYPPAEKQLVNEGIFFIFVKPTLNICKIKERTAEY
jgi:hypothetical protein